MELKKEKLGRNDKMIQWNGRGCTIWLGVRQDGDSGKVLSAGLSLECVIDEERVGICMGYNGVWVHFT